MNNNDKKDKEIESKNLNNLRIQLDMFELLDPSLKDYSNSIELYDTMPKYYIGGVKREKGKLVESLPILSREFVHRNKLHKIDISPAAIHNKKTGKTIYYYPAQREELVEDALRKIATRGKSKEIEENQEKKVGVTFTYYELQQELIDMGHGYSIKDIKLAIEILSKSTIEITSEEKKVSITSNFFTFVGKEIDEKKGKEKVLVVFHNLISSAINSGNYRLFNYNKLMKLKMPLSRWLHRRISHMFTQATLTNPYNINLSTITRDSGISYYNTISERIRQVEKALDELKIDSVNIVSKWEKDIDKYKNKIIDVKYFIYMSEEFVSDTKKANKINNLKDLKEVKCIDRDLNSEIESLKKDLEDSFFGLTKTVIDNILNKVQNIEDYKKTVVSLKAAKEYIEHKEGRGDRVIKSAIVKTAIKENWEPKKLINKEVEENTIIRVTKDKINKPKYKKNKNDSFSKKITEYIKKNCSKDEWEKWLSKLEYLTIENNKIIFQVRNKFERNWIIKEYIENNKLLEKNKTDLINTIKELNININLISIIIDNSIE